VISLKGRFQRRRSGWKGFPEIERELTEGLGLEAAEKVGFTFGVTKNWGAYDLKSVVNTSFSRALSELEQKRLD